MGTSHIQVSLGSYGTISPVVPGLPLFRAWLHRLDPERAHQVVLTLLRLAGRWAPVRQLWARWWDPGSAPVCLWGRQFRHPVGLAAGYDKNAVAWPALLALGFAFVEVGTVTWRPQGGSPRPRIVRVPEAHALVNWMGFPNRGAAFVLPRVRRRRQETGILGVNLGRNRETPNERAAEEYARLAQAFAPWVDFVTVNISSPNTPELRDLHHPHYLTPLLRQVSEALEISAGASRPVLLLKVSPDLSWPELDAVLEAAQDAGVAGIIATNTTVDKSGLPARYRGLPGGVSGAPLRERSTQVLAYIRRAMGPRFPLIGVGGILYAQDALDKRQAGADLVQIFTGWVYRGPVLISDIVQAWRQGV